VQIRDIDKVRLISKREEKGSYITAVKSLSIGDFSVGMAKALGSSNPLSDHAFAAGLHIFSREVSEGFFADKILLVEGVSDKAILEGMFLKLGADPYREGISIIQVDGKTKIDKPLFAFRKLGIPVYPVFDNDRTTKHCKDSEGRNRLIQTICECENIEAFPVGVLDKFACFDGNLERYLKDVLNDGYPKLIEEVCSAFQLTAKDAVKTPAVVSALLIKADSQGHKFSMIEEIVQKVRSLT
jgi:predicted ATP-dependent endonuclease of OLD family